MSDNKKAAAGGGGGGGGGKQKQQTIGGAPTKQRVNEFYDLMDAAQESGPVIPDLDLTDPAPGVNAYQDFVLKNQGKFPIRPLPKDPYDTIWKIKEDLKTSNYASAARPLPVTEDDLRYLKGKAAAEDYTAFLTWEASKYDLSDPATKEWFHKVCPSYFEQREQLIDDMIDLQAKYAKIRLRGPRSEDDLKLEFLIEKGDVNLPVGPVWDPINIYTSNLTPGGGLGPQSTQRNVISKAVEYNKSVYQAGLFSPLVPISVADNPNTNHQKLMAPNPFNRSDVRGDPTTRFTGISGGLPPIQSNYAQYAGQNLGIDRRLREYNNPETEYHAQVNRGWNAISGAYGALVGGNNAQPAANQPLGAPL
jgi:hypothetical protein